MIGIGFQPLYKYVYSESGLQSFRENWSLKQIVNSFFEAALDCQKISLEVSDLQKTCTQFPGASDFTHDVAGRLDEVNKIWPSDSATSSPQKNIIQPLNAGGLGTILLHIWISCWNYRNFHTTHHLFQAHPQGQLPKRNMKGNWKYSLGSFKRLYLGICCVSREYSYFLKTKKGI